MHFPFHFKRSKNVLRNSHSFYFTNVCMLTYKSKYKCYSKYPNFLYTWPYKIIIEMSE